MTTQITVRVQEDLNREVYGMAKRLHLKRSDIVRMALEKFVRGDEGVKQGTAYEQVKNLIGSVASGLPDLGKSHRKYLVERMKRRA
ncbi:MAG: hypothetical protein HY266_09700 [Deltaproteobacteria bacterium]|nr:hypothetical protein [Deltaproteobacteria bacterium]